MVGTIILLSGLMVGMYTFFIALCRTSALADEREPVNGRGRAMDIEALSRRPWANVCETDDPTRIQTARRGQSSAPIVV